MANPVFNSNGRRVRRKEIYDRGDILLVDVEGRGSEHRGKKYGVVISNNVGSRHGSILQVSLITSQHKNRLPTHCNLDTEFFGCKHSTFMAEQIKTIDYKNTDRVIEFMGKVSKEEMRNIDRCIAIQLGLVKPR